MIQTSFLSFSFSTYRPIVVIVAILLLASDIILSTNAYVPHQQLQDLQGSLDSVIQKALESPSFLVQKSPLTPPPGAVTGSSSKSANVHQDTTKVAATTAAARHAIQHKRWGIDNTNENEYWYDSRIHTLGNCGIMGAVHAALAPISTKMIDNIAYEGVDIRGQVAKELSAKYHKSKAKVLDLCCGVGFSTRALTDAFPDAEQIVGIDTSPQMLAMARFISNHVIHLRPMWNTVVSESIKLKEGARSLCATSFMKGNAESTPFQDASFDVVTVMYAFHEAPKRGRQRIIEEARRLLSPGGVLAVIDISTDYQPSKSMLAGEPYVIEYQKNIHNQMRSQRGFTRAKYQNLVPGHVGMWVLRKSYA